MKTNEIRPYCMKPGCELRAKWAINRKGFASEWHACARHLDRGCRPGETNTVRGIESWMRDAHEANETGPLAPCIRCGKLIPDPDGISSVMCGEHLTGIIPADQAEQSR